MSKLTDSGTLNIKNALGKTGTVYLIIPASRKSTGKVSLEVQGRSLEMNAITDDEADIPTGSIITVLEIVNNSLLLVKRQ